MNASFPSSADYHPLCSNLAEENVDKLSCLHVGASSCKPCVRWLGSELRSYELGAREAELCRESQHCDVEKAKEMSGNENADEKNVCRPLLKPLRARRRAAQVAAAATATAAAALSHSLDLTDTRACCCCCSNQLGIIIPWGLHEVLRGLRQHLLVVHTSFPPTYSFYTVIERVHSNCNFLSPI